MYLQSVIGALIGMLLVHPSAEPVSTAAGHRNISSAETITGYGMSKIESVIASGRAARIWLGLSKQGRRIDAWYFPGTSDQRALVIGGVHGSELSSTEVAFTLISQLAQAEKPYYSVVIIPTLFPDNAAAAIGNPTQMGSVLNIGRYSHATAVDPNRQMPTPGKAFDPDTGIDHLGRVIERENQLLLELIALYRPTRIANVHAIRNTGYGGIYADPRTDHLGLALGYATDSSLAVEMAKTVQQLGGNVNGNQLQKKPNALYYKDPVPAAPGMLQKRNMTGSALNAHRGSGVSMGTWGTTAIAWETDLAMNREAMRVITVEFPGAKRPLDFPTMQQQVQCSNEVNAFAISLYQVFLGNYYPEDMPEADQYIVQKDR